MKNVTTGDIATRLKDISYATRVPFQQLNYLDFPGNGNCRFADCPGKWQMKVRKEEPAKKMLDFEWESSEVAAVNAVREVVAPGSGKFPATNHPTHSSSLGCSNETYKLLKCSPTTSTIAPQSSRAVPSFVSGVLSQSTK